MYELNTNLRLFLNKPDEKENISKCLKNWTKLLNNKYIKFKDLNSEKPLTLKEIIYKFFFLKEPTYYINNRTQCSVNRRRSLIDFYMLQNTYLVKPLTMEECYDIYFNKLDRNLDQYQKELIEANMFRKKDSEGITHYVHVNFQYYYCPTVNRNVFRRSDSYNDIVLDAKRRMNKVTLEEEYKRYNLNIFDDYTGEILLEPKSSKKDIRDIKNITQVIPELANQIKTV